ncbi:MAG TPA: efflux RND transporter permease subunit, partial [Nevskiaceae bacterium]|nr:efflux RND transporter permease subunit [Nevskiaceae bacterium]
REILEQDLAGKIMAAADAEASPAVKVHVTGAAIIRAATSNSVTRQLRWVVPAFVVMLAVFLGFTFRSWAGVLLPLATICIALTLTLGTLAALGHPLNLITSLVPPLLVTMGLAYCAHILCEYQQLGGEGQMADAQMRIALLLSEVTGPVLLTGFTTAVGLLAIAFNPLPAITEFAWLSAVGVFYTVVLVLTFLPAALRFMPAARAHDGRSERLFERVGRRVGEFDVRQRRLILLCAGLLAVVALAACTLIRVGDQFVGIFPERARVRADFEAVNRLLGGVNPLSIVIDGPTDIFTEPYVLRSLDELEQWLLHQPEVGAVTTLSDHVKELAANLAHAQNAGIPSSRDMVKQLLFFGDGELLRGVVNSQRSSTLVTLRLRVDDTADISEFVERLRPELDRLPTGLTAHITGNTMLVTDSVAGATSGQIQSVAFALFVIYLCLALQFASWSVGLLATLPTALQTAIYFGALGISGITLNATTSLVECLVLGLAVDDTIHYLARFNTTARRVGSEQNAAVAALSAVLRPVTLTKVILALGFLMLITGDLRNQVLFGWLAALTLATAWMVDVFVTPAFISGVRVVTLWDSLRLNLGHDVQGTIPLFAGLSTRQARVFALMSQIIEVPAGTRLMTEGESAGDGEKGDPRGDVYVVIDGQLQVWTERDGARRDLTTLGRGAVVGETGYFGQRRMATVDTLTRARLLRFDDADQEMVMRRYPKIAARVFLNLNRIQAARRAENARVAVTAHG